MYLKTIKLAGFKSFVDPTTIPVRSNMSAIVGPNGCGKSNIVDAIRWVIGESSAKQLRGQSMSDVIFNGTTNRKPVGKASVELHFDNTSNRLVGEFAKYADIVIRREVERDGQSSYFLNGSHCRRKDILDVFLGTGLGSRSYSIIEQGMISQLIEAKPDDMRAHIEEVAGISKYKERRRETENRIRHTQENLERLNDIREELIKQLRHLKRQANAAERYQEYKQEERVLESQIKALHWQALETKRKSSQAVITEQELLREQNVALLRQHEADIDKAKVDGEELQDQTQTVQKRYYGLGEEIARLEQQIKNHQDQIATWQKELAETDSIWEELTESTAELNEQISEIEAEVEGLAPQSGQITMVANAANKALVEAEAKMQLWQQTWDDFQQESSDVISQEQVANTKIEHKQQHISHLTERAHAIDQGFKDLPLENTRGAIAPLTEQVVELDAQFNSNKQSIDNNFQEITEHREQNKQIQQSVRSTQSELQNLQSEYAKVDGLQQAALGLNDQTTSKWLKAQDLEINPRLGQQIKVNSGWEKAVETVLSGYFDAICVDQVEQFAGHVNEINNGRVTLIDKSLADTNQQSSNAKTLISQIESAWPLTQWLQGIYIAESETEALSMRSQLGVSESVITKDGIWHGKNWLRVSKLKDPQSGILARESKLNLLTSEIKAKQELLESKEQQQKQGMSDILELEKARDHLQTKNQNFASQLAQKQAELSKKEAELENLIKQEARFNPQAAEIATEIENCNRELIDAQHLSQGLNEKVQGLTQKRESLQTERDCARTELDEKRLLAQKERQAADELEIRLSANESQLALLRQTILRDEKRLAQLSDRRSFLLHHLSEDDSPLENLKDELQQKLTARLGVEQELKAVEHALAEMRSQLKQLEQSKQSTVELIESIQLKLQKLQIEAQETIVRAQTIKESLSESNLELEKVISELPEEAEVVIWEQRLENLNSRIQRLGLINLAAIDEFQTGTERQEYLDKQFEDLTESLAVLQAAIAKIDRETKTRFRETYDKVNESFQAIFPRIFGGGRAQLEMCENDLLKTGILVKAQPPGKRNSTIHMLSGGEKALTAISLVFAMFSLNPAPFCILDEVDAPLDDLNVGRFCQLVKEMSKETQFLIISHNKVTIEIADHLMGVTMQEAGVSRLVAVDMEQALDMMETV